MRKSLIILCSSLLLIIAGWQVADFITYKKEIKPAYKEEDLKSNYTVITVSAVGDCTFATDINATGSGSFVNEVKAVNYDYTHFLKNVSDIFNKDNLTIVNFEGTLSERGTRADKEFAFRGNPEYVNILTSSSVEAVNLSNNHSRDYGDISKDDTKAIMSENDIVWFEGDNFTVTEVNGIKIGLIGTNTQRSNEVSAFIENLEKLKALSPDLIIANFHWGEELAHSPNATQKNLAHTAIDNGADLVIGHHPHVLQGIEKYKNKYILYSLGNFCFGGNKNPTDKDTMIFQQTFLFENGKLRPKERVSVIPCSISSEKTRNNYQPTPLLGDDFKRVKKKIIERSKDFEGIENIEFIEKK
ncbi:MAG: CapA family protein [Ruminococcaceae bacterium]|nr:CapA family protein [Oscillospiraceae bacterium]